MKVVRLSRVLEMTALSRASLRRLEQAGDFPPRVRLTAGSVGWAEEDIVSWLRSRVERVSVKEARS